MINRKYDINTRTPTEIIGGSISSSQFYSRQEQFGTIQNPLSYPSILLDESKIEALKSEIREELRKEFEEKINAHLQYSEKRVILIEELPYPETKSRIADFIKKKKTTDFGEIQDALHFELKTIVRAVKELLAEQKVRERD